MDFSMPEGVEPEPPNPAKSAILLACRSKSYFEGFLNRSGVHPLLLTNGLMAPEAYTLDSALKSWLADENAAQTHEGRRLRPITAVRSAGHPGRGSLAVPSRSLRD